MVFNCVRDDSFSDNGLRIPMPKLGQPSVVDFFDPHNPEHLKAFDELDKTGIWPKGFIDGLEIPPMWAVQLMNKMARAWVHHNMEAGGLKGKLHQAKVRLMNLHDHRPEVETAVAVMGEVEHTLLA
jgi:hypothetical protein